MTPAQYTLRLWRGNTEPLAFRFKQANGDPFDLSGSTLILKIDFDSGVLIKSSAQGDWVIDDPASGEARVTLSAADTRSICGGVRPARFEIERHVGDEQRTLLFGKVVVEGGTNVD